MGKGRQAPKTIVPSINRGDDWAQIGATHVKDDRLAAGGVGHDLDRPELEELGQVEGQRQHHHGEHVPGDPGRIAKSALEENYPA